MSFLPGLSLFVGAWMVLNGILHDFFILRSEHGKTYDRDLLRLLMDGHILITCGTMQIIAFFGLRQQEYWAYFVAGAACISLFVYCCMIFPFLKSLVTMAMNLVLLGLLILNYVRIF